MNNEYKAIEFTAYKDSKGFERSLTLRGDSGTEVIEKMDKAITSIMEKGGTPVSKNFTKFNKPEVPTKPCPIHEVPMKEKISKSGEKFYSHSKGVYPDLIYCNGKGWPTNLREEVEQSFTEHEEEND